MLSAMLLLSTSVFAAEIAKPESVGMSSTALTSATARLQKHIDDGDIAGVVAAGVEHQEQVGEVGHQATPAPNTVIFDPSPQL